MALLHHAPAPGTGRSAGTGTLRVLHVINMGSTCGGAERLVAELVVAQRAAGHHVRVLASDRVGSGLPFADATWPQRPRPGLWRRLTGMLRNPAARRALGGQLTEWRPDVVHLHTVGLVAPATLAVLRDVATVLTLHGPELFLRTTERWCLPGHHFVGADPDRLTPRGRLALAVSVNLIGPLWRRRLRVVDVFVAPSRYLARLAARDFAPVTVVPNGVRASPLVPRQRVAANGGPTVLFAGRLERFKGAQLLLAAVPRVLAAVPQVRVVLCGTGPMDGALRTRIAELGLGGTVELTGWLDPDALHRRIAEADVVVVPSVWPEAFGMGCLEAFGAGTAVVASDVGALPELVEPEVTGLLVPPGDPVALAAAVRRLIEEPDTRRRLAAAARERSAAYGIGAHADGVQAAYRTAIRRRADRPTDRPALPRRWWRGLAADSLVRNSVTLLLATVVLAAGGFLFWQLAAHAFGPADIGQASALISMSTLLASLALLGMNNSLIRYLGAWPDPGRTVNSAVVAVAGAALLAGLAFAAVARVVAPQVADALGGLRTAAFVALTVAGALGMLYDNVFIAARRTGHILVRNAVTVALRLVLPLALLRFGGFGVFTAYWLAFGLALVPYLAVLRRTYPLRSRVSLRRLRAMCGYSIGTHAATVILMVPTLLMPTVVAQRVGLRAAGYYYVASLVASVLLFIPEAASRSLFAEASADQGRPAGQLRRALTLTAVGQLAVLVVLLAGGWPALRLFGAGYPHAYPLLVLLALTNVLGSVGYLGSTLLLVANRVRLLVALSAVSYAVSVVGGYLLAPRGLVWVGAALLAGEAVLAAGYLRIIVRALR